MPLRSEDFTAAKAVVFPYFTTGTVVELSEEISEHPLSISRARSGIIHEYSSTGRFSPYPSDAPSHELSSRDLKNIAFFLAFFKA